MKRYKHIFFDLDRTLWDFEANSRAAFDELYETYNLSGDIPSSESLFLTYNKYNEKLWKLLRQGKVEKKELRKRRFIQTFEDFGIKNNSLADKIGRDYIALCPTKTHLLPGTIEVLEFLITNHDLHILTNGFPETQRRKIKYSGLDRFFKSVMISEEVGWQKPDIRIFQYAMQSLNAKVDESIMVGDDFEVDVLGAINAGIDQVYFNRINNRHNEIITYEITSLSQLKDLPCFLY